MDESIEKAKSLEPQVRVGKNGLTEGILEEIKKQLKKKKMIKVKFLRSFIAGRDKKEVGKELASLTDSELVQQVGFVVVLRKK